MPRIIAASLAAGAALLTVGCTGNRIGDSALIGAGAGAVAGEVISGSPLPALQSVRRAGRLWAPSGTMIRITAAEPLSISRPHLYIGLR